MSERTDFRPLYFREDDELIEVKATDNSKDIFLDYEDGTVYPFQ